MMNLLMSNYKDFITSSNEVKGLFNPENKDKKEVKIYFRDGKNFLDDLFLELTTSDIKIENIPIFFVRYYNFLFIGRYLVIQLLIVTLQKLKVGQAFLILILQVVFVITALNTQVKKGGLYENQFLTWKNIIQECCIIFFLLMTVIIGFGLAKWTGEKGIFYIEFFGAISVLISLFIEVIGFLIVIVEFLIWIYKVFRKYFCCCFVGANSGKKKRDKRRVSQSEVMKIRVQEESAVL